jgi:signal transduction histidine kinase
MTLLIAGLLVLLLAALGGFWLADRAMRPVQAITATAQRIEASDLSRRLALNRRDELGELAATFDHMLDRLESAFTRQRQFTADASHELRTPLTIIELKASRLLDQDSLTERERADLTVIQQERQHMTHLVDDLLFLARADAGHTRARHEIVHLDELILEVVERFAPLAQERCLRVEVGDLPDLTVFGDRLYLLRMLGNLVENALKYSGPDGTCVRLDLAPCEQAGAQWARLTVSDDGPGIPAQHLPHVFERFYRADVSRTHSDAAAAETSERAGSGLGLAIARWIAQAHNGNITIESSADRGTVCTVMLPLECANA